ncbi:type II toxin-antitoxin system RelE/ParE family toxin [Candidatus Peregrinibacteria bacterium]|nr:type II toxin-antitoxin system RelE/ParE family toxin [Candidatus Peregrinibacteria bacterium]
MVYRIFYARSAERYLDQLNSHEAHRITQKIAQNVASGHPLKFAKKLKGLDLPTYRFRIGDYRAIFRIHQDGSIYLLYILRIAHRKEVYRDID